MIRPQSKGSATVWKKRVIHDQSEILIVENVILSFEFICWLLFDNVVLV
jgi:hypothetical protein